MTKIVRGNILTIGTGKDSFQIVADAMSEYAKPAVVSGPLFGQDGGGLCKVPVDDVTKIEPATKKSDAVLKRANEPVTFKVSPKQATLVLTAPEQPKKKGPPRRESTGPTKLDLAIDIARANPKASRKELIDLLIAGLGMTPAGASTYASNARKAATKE